MSNQAQSIANDLMVGAGVLYFERDDDTHGLHHLGNVDEFNITTDVTTVEKNSSMNQRRELMASVVTAVNPSATLTMTEYNPYNLALGLFGTENVHNQAAVTLTNQAYTVKSVPGVLELTDANGERYMNVSDVVIGLTAPQPASFKWSNVGSDYAISTDTADSDTITDNHSVAIPEKVMFDASSLGTDYTVDSTGMVITDTDTTDGGGTITISTGSGLSGVTATTNVSIEVTTGTTATGDLDGLVLSVTEGGGSAQTFTATAGLTTETFTTTNGMEITVDVTTGTGLTVTGSAVTAYEVPAGTGSAGGTFKLGLGTFSGTTGETVYVTIVNGTTANGDLAGLQFTVMEGALGGVQSFTATGGSTSELFTLTSGMTITANVTATTGIASNPTVIEAQVTPALSEYEAGKDYILDKQMLRAGIVQIPAGSKIPQNTVVAVSAKVPEGAFVTVSGSSAGEISGRLVFIGDPNIGGMYNIEAWKVKITPEGDFTGLISTDFGSFTLNIRFLADYENHPAYPYYRATLVGRADGSSKTSGVYDPNY